MTKLRTNSATGAAMERNTTRQQLIAREKQWTIAVTSLAASLQPRLAYAPYLPPITDLTWSIITTPVIYFDRLLFLDDLYIILKQIYIEFGDHFFASQIS